MEFQANIPYPEIEVERKNIEYAKILSCAYAGIISEDTAIHLYMYQSFILDNSFGEILGKIAIVEMHHLEMLAKTIKSLGLNPKYKTYESDKYFNGEYVKYSNNLNEILDINIK